MAYQFGAHTLSGGANGGQLVEHLAAIAPFEQHPLDALRLPFDLAQSLDQIIPCF